MLIINDQLLRISEKQNVGLETKGTKSEKHRLTNDYDKLKSEVYGLQPYKKTMTVPLARTNFAVRARMLSSVMMNFKNNPEYREREYRCGCGEEDHQAHLTSCSLYTHLQECLNLETDIELVQFFS